VESEPGQGACFHFTIRTRIAMPTGLLHPSDPTGLGELAVLVVDDNATNRMVIGKPLERWEMRPVLAENATEALRQLKDARQNGLPFQLVIVDAMMPEVDGFALVEEFARHRLG
jgi:PleD family two-component response regulator